MNFDIRLPNIKATTPQGQMAEMQSYMFQLAEQLNWAFNTINEAQNSKDTSKIAVDKGNGVKESISPEEAESTFNSIKALIIKSADIVKAYEETIKTEFNGLYVAESDFGTYKEETSRNIEENSKGVTEIYENIQTIKNFLIEGDDENNENKKTTKAFIKRGYLGDYRDSGKAAYGIAIGETDEDEYKNYAWFTADKLSFFDEGGYEVAYIGAGCLYIVGRAVFLGEIQLGGYQMDMSDGLAFTWVGGVD